MDDFRKQITTAIAHCLSWNSDHTSDEVTQVLNAASADLHDPFKTFETAADLKKFTEKYPLLWNSRIGLVYGGATKIKQYVFESADLQEIRGASALLDRINLVDLPAFFHAETEADSDRFSQCREAAVYCRRIRSSWLHHHFPTLENALTPEMVIYSTGGNILAFCPTDLVDDLTNAIEKRYITETLTANACAVGAKFAPLEIYLGRLNRSIEDTLWLDQLEPYVNNPAFRAYFGLLKETNEQGQSVEALTPEEAFGQRKGFSELVGKLANQFNQRRSGYDTPDRTTSRRYPPMFETHPYLMRDGSDRRSLVLELTPASVLEMNPEQSDDKLKVEEILPDNPKFSEPSARKRWIGQVTKRENSRWRAWYRKTELLEKWNPIQVLDDEAQARGIEFRTEQQKRIREDLFKVGLSSWVNKFEQFLFDHEIIDIYDPSPRKIFTDSQSLNTERPDIQNHYTRETRSLTEIGSASNGYVAYIYADGNNMGAYIRDQIKTPEHYQQFSQDVFEATEKSVYWALAHCVKPHRYTPDAKSSRDNKAPVWIHPFEIIAIGGDDVLLIVPANMALEVAQKIGEKFETILQGKTDEDVNGNKRQRYGINPADQKDASSCHRYRKETAPQSKCCLSISSGVLITAVNTPIYYADKLVSQLLKSAKKKAKDLRENGHFGGTVDFLTLKAVTMISSNVESFRNEGLTVHFSERNQELKLYAAPYTLHELGGLIKTVRVVKESGFPRSQLYQIRSLLEQGKRTAILNYRYFRVRLGKKEQRLLERDFEAAWCEAETNQGNLAPWLTAIRKNSQTTYETLWRELVELYEFIQVSEDIQDSPEAPQSLQGEEASS
ncbi:type III-B CRISPR-associated protein Cas10/Cmr2 [Oscillatoria sp. CS-180]|uniref:type III-B CRISPR-associated protein Cas10/Cmr2 n=1 Tax=Oscillatoria sp. CS-180 TaxID=3021720 RepID=UPI00232E6E9D|nr:type III-B CRISPR-associated protein Cas10/Cmr2 [Oscillatoria sp. CS-180]MDB9526790.1 type III-B CRISPR-associated protein Cas10/Cmr2 [Oscillatoria sp. CS-180]